MTKGQGQIEVWVTLPDRSALFEKQAETIAFSDRNSGRGGPAIVIDEGQPMQTIDGFGFAITGGTSELLMKMNPDIKILASPWSATPDTLP